MHQPRCNTPSCREPSISSPLISSSSVRRRAAPPAGPPAWCIQPRFAPGLLLVFHQVASCFSSSWQTPPRPVSKLTDPQSMSSGLGRIRVACGVRAPERAGGSRANLHLPTRDRSALRCKKFFYACVLPRVNVPNQALAPSLVEPKRSGGGPGHSLHAARIQVSGVPLVFCSFCGRSATQKVLSLMEPCVRPRRSSERNKLFRRFVTGTGLAQRVGSSFPMAPFLATLTIPASLSPHPQSHHLTE